MAEDSDLNQIMSELVLSKEQFAVMLLAFLSMHYIASHRGCFQDYKNEELITYCMLLDTIGDHEACRSLIWLITHRNIFQAMLNCASVHVKKTCSGGPPLRPQEEVNQRDMFAVACKKCLGSSHPRLVLSGLWQVHHFATRNVASAAGEKGAPLHNPEFNVVAESSGVHALLYRAGFHGRLCIIPCE